VPYASSELGYEDQDNVLWSMKLHPTYEFIWRKEIVDDEYLLRTRASVYPKPTN